MKYRPTLSGSKVITIDLLPETDHENLTLTSRKESVLNMLRSQRWEWDMFSGTMGLVPAGDGFFRQQGESADERS